MNSLRAFVYFVEVETIEGLLPDWQHDMRLALCLKETGQCEIIFFHKNEAQYMIGRVSKLLKVPTKDLGVIPEVKGYPVKAIRFSDQQRLLKLLVENKDICEKASDYAINYRFAEEEGLDPGQFTRLSHKGKTHKPKPKPKESALVKPFTSRRTKSKVQNDIQLPLKKITPQENALFSGQFAEIARIEQFNNHVHLILNPDAVTDGLTTVRAMDVLHLNEPNQFQLERPLFRNWQTGQPAIIKMSADLILNRFPTQYLQRPRVAVVLIMPHGVFVTCGSIIPPLEPALEPISFPYHKALQQRLTHTSDQRAS